MLIVFGGAIVGVLVEAFDIPPEATARVVAAIAEAGGVPVVETRHNRVLRELYGHATEEQMRLIGSLEMARMERMDCYIGLRGGPNSTEFADVPAEKITVLHQGQVLAEGTPTEVRSNPEVQRVYLGETA